MAADKKKNARMLESLSKGDMIGIETPEERYVLYWVTDIRSDSVFYRVSERTENEIYLLDNLKEIGEAAFTKEIRFILKSKLVEMNKAGTLEEITRKEMR